MNSFDTLAANSKDFARQLLTAGENRVELLALELQEELHRLSCMLMLMLGVAVFGLLSGIALTAALVLALNYPLVTVLLYVTGIYIVAGLILYWRLARLLKNWQLFAASVSQFRKDRQ